VLPVCLCKEKPVDPTIIVGLSGLVSAAIAALVTFVVAARRMSGKIKTSDASDLWAVAKDMRAELTSRLGVSDGRLRDLETRMATLERENIALLRENTDLKQKIETQQTLIEALREKIDTQATLIEALQHTIESLEESKT